MQGLSCLRIGNSNNYSYDGGREKFGRDSIYLGELEKLIFDSTSILEDENDVFVISYCVIESDKPSFRFASSNGNCQRLFVLPTLVNNTVEISSTFS